ncbi:hypothetical protein SRHO_G00201260 [Serrasalmus rhombeus]
MGRSTQPRPSGERGERIRRRARETKLFLVLPRTEQSLLSLSDQSCAQQTVQQSSPCLGAQRVTRVCLQHWKMDTLDTGHLQPPPCVCLPLLLALSCGNPLRAFAGFSHKYINFNGVRRNSSSALSFQAAGDHRRSLFAHPAEANRPAGL